MNKIYKIVWNKALGQMVVVSENAKSAAKGTTVGTHLSRPLHKTQNVSACPQWLLCSLSLSMALVANATWAGVANTALPTGANITQGSAQISQNNNSLNINQNSQNLSTNWNTFNIGKDATVNFNQPNQSSIAVNRVLDNNASQIMGKLNANGQVFLLNPNGVIFSKTAQVNVGGLVASTLNLSDSDIAQGKFTLKNNGNAGSVENYGSIIANGGVVALIAPTVKNYGTIQAHNGTVHLTAADQVTLQLQDGSLVEYQIDLGTLQGLVENGGAIQADNGAVYLTAQAKNSLSKAVVNHTGIIEANRLSKNAKGEIILLADMQHGTTTVSGTLKAEGKNGADGGFIETSAANVQIQDSTKVSTLSDSGKTGEWLIDPTDFNINAGNAVKTDSGIGATTLQTNLANTSMILQTVVTGSGKGDINVNAAVTWTSPNSLTLNAHNDININANITATNGKLNLIYGTSTANYYANTSNYYLNNGAKVNLKAGQNFSTQKGADTARKIDYTVITDLGAAGSTTKTDLQGMSGDLLWNYVLGADINAAATSGWNGGLGFTPVGTGDPYSAVTTPFKGRFDGLGHSISNLYINRPTETYVGLFGSSSAFNSGGTFRHVGMVGVNVTGKRHVGGLVGEARSGIVENSYATGQVTGEDYVGGLVGYGFDGYIKKSYAAVDVTATSTVSHAGGLIGDLSFSTGRIENSYATGSVEGKSYTGGLVGSVTSDAKVVNSYATGDVKGSGAVGGLVGISTHRSQIANSYATGKVEGISNIGGLVGSNTYGSRINNVYATGEVEGINNIGGLVGYNAITSNVDGVTKASISNAYSTGSVTGKNLAGGLVGVNDANATISNAYATGAVDGANSGGLVGGNGSTASISNVYATGAVVGANSGGLVGDNRSSTTSISNGYWNTETSVQANAIGSGTATGVTGLTTVQMKQGASFVGFDIDGQGGTGKVWRIYEGHTAPLLRSFLTQATLGTVANQSKTYNGQMQSVDLSGVSLAGLNTDKVFAGQSSSKNVGTYNAGYYSNQQGYDFVGGNASLTITKANLAITGLSAFNKVYDTNTVATLTGTPTIAQFGSDSVTLGGDVVAAFANKNVGTNKAVTVTGFTLSGADAGNYNLVQPTGLKANISKADLALAGLSAGNKVYNGNTLADLFGTASVSPLGSDAVVLSGTGIANFADKNVGNNKTVTVSGYTLGGTDAANYNLVQPTGGLKANISKADLALAGLSAGNKVYNGNTLADLFGTASVSPLGSDAVVLSGTGIANFADKNVGNNKTVTVTGYTLSGTDAGNYNLVQPTGLTATISQRTLNATLTAQNKIYDGNTSASVSYGDDRIGQDALTITGTATFNDKNAATGKTVTANNLALTGTDAGNYELASTTATTQADIDKATLTATITAQNKIYDGNNSASVSYGDDRIGQDVLVVSGTATFSDKNAATGKTVTANNLALTGTDAGNYELASTTATTQANIDKATLTATLNAQNKIYDGNTSASVSYGDDRIGQDVLVISGTATFNDKNAATGKTVTANGLALTGTDAGNYELASTTATTQADIDKATLTATITAQNKIYDGNNSASVSYGDDRIGQDVLVVSGTATFSDKNAATGKTVTATGLALTGTDAGNYELASTTATTQADIDKATLTATLNAQNKIYDGNTSASVSYGDDRIGQDVLVVSGTATFSDKNAGNGKTVTANNLALTGTDAGNYELASTTATTQADIDKATLTATITAQNKIYDGNNSASVSYGDDRIGQDVLVVSGTATFNDKNAATGKTVTANNLALTGTDAGNYELASTTATTQADIDKATLTATLNAQNKIYDGNTSASVSYGDDRIGQDVLVVSGTATFSDKNAGSNKTVIVNGLTLSGADAGNYVLAATTATDTADISKAQAIVTANSLNTTYNGQNQTASGFSATGLVNGEDSSVLTGVTASVTAKDAGSYTNKANGVDKNYDLTFVDGALEIAKAKATVTANSLNTVYNGKDQTVTGFTASGLVAGEDEAVLSGVTATVTGKNAGSYINTATGTDGNYDITFVDGALEIAKAKATVTANSLNTVYNGQNQTASGFSATGLVNGEDSSVLTGVTASVTAKDAGSYTNKANGVDKNYDLTFVDGALEIAKAKATVTANSLNTVYNGKDQTVTGFTASGLVAGEDEAVLSGVTATVTGKNAGSYINTATGTDGNYDITFVDGALEIAKAKATVTANSLNTVYNGQNQTASGFSATGLVNGEDSSVLTGVTASVTAKDAGSYTNKANGVDKNYDLTFVGGALEIAKAKATVTANSLNTVYNGQNQIVSGFTASGLVNGETESVLSNVSASVTAQEVGNYANKATGSDDNYELTFVDGVLSIQAKPIVPVPPQPPVVPSYYPIWGNPYQRAIRTQSVQQKTKAFDIVEIEIEGNGINMDNIQTLGSN